MDRNTSAVTKRIVKDQNGHGRPTKNGDLKSKTEVHSEEDHDSKTNSANHHVSVVISHKEANGNGKIENSPIRPVLKSLKVGKNELVDPELSQFYCPSHTGQSLNLFCQECDISLCGVCVEIDHRNHLTVHSMEMIIDDSIPLDRLMGTVQNKVHRLQDAISKSEKAMCLLSESKSESIKQINSLFSNLIQKLKDRQNALVCDVNDQFVSKMEEIQKKRSQLSNNLKEMNECCLLLETTLNHKSDADIPTVRKQIRDHFLSYTNLDLSKAVTSVDDSLEFDGHSIESLDVESLGRVVSEIHKSWAVSGEVFESRCVPVGRRHFLRLHLSTNYLPKSNIRIEDIHIQSSTKECVFSLEQPRDSDLRFFVIRFLVSKIGPFNISVQVKRQHISGSPFQFHAYEPHPAEDRSNSQSPVPYMNGSASSSALHSPSIGYPTYRNPKTNGRRSVSPRSRMSTPTKKFHSNGCFGSLNGHGAYSLENTNLEDDLILKIGRKGRNRGEFTNPQGVASSQTGRLIVTDSNNQCIQIFDITGECKLKFGVRGRTVGQLQRPVGVAVFPTNGNIAIADYDNKWISIYDPTGKFMSRIGHGKLLGPKGLTVDTKGQVYVVDNKASCILVFQPNGKLLLKFGSRGNDDGQFAGPHFIAVNSRGNIIVTDFHNHCVKVFDFEGEHLFSFGSNGDRSGQFNAPTGIAVDSSDNILVADWGNSRIQVFDSEGTFLRSISTSADPLYGPQGLTVTGDGYVAIADSGNHCVKLYKYL